MVDRKLSHVFLRGALLALCALCMGAVLCASASRPRIPPWVSWQTRQISCGDEGPELLELSSRRARAWSRGQAVWSSGEDILVQDLLWCDIDHDGAGELLLLCWKQGRYGACRPFWVEEDETDWSQHIYIYDWRSSAMYPIWMASELGRLVKTWRFDDEDRLVLTELTGRQTTWDWREWGLSCIDPLPSAP